jgi:hypothetical protein
MPLQPALEDGDAHLAPENRRDQVFDRVGPSLGSPNELDGGTHSTILAVGGVHRQS